MKRDSLAESLMHEIWKDHSTFLIMHPLLSDGSPVIIIHAGDYNDHRGGPDFLNAEIALDGVRIKGDIELHKSLEDWEHHGHSGDANYSQVILHVVLDSDQEEFHGAIPKVPLLILRDNLAFDQRVFWKELFEKQYARSPELPCFPHNLSTPMKFKKKMLDRMGEARLDERISRVSVENGSEEALHNKVYELTFDALGYSENRKPFITLSRFVSRTLLQKIRDQESEDELLSIYEALYFGTAGLIHKPSDEYDNDVNEYLLDISAKWEALKIDYSISEKLAEYDWAFFRIRPLNTPYRRIALASVLATKYFSRPDYSVREEMDYKLGDSSFWERHTSFKSHLSEPHALLGEERMRAITLNVVLPARMVNEKGNLQRKGLDDQKVLTALRPLRKQWADFPSRASAAYLGVIEQELLEGEHISTTIAEQGALFLHRNYCTALRCSECPVGIKLSEKDWKPTG
jgi:hypothetical protein